MDKNTYKAWGKLTSPENEKENLDQCVDFKDSVGIIQLNEHKKCPFLNEQKLCKLVIAYGDNVLSDTCATFPRKVYDFDDRSEYSLVACCPEVVDLLKIQDRIGFSQELTKMEGDLLFHIRNVMISIIEEENRGNSKNLMMAFYILLDIHQKKKISKEELKEYLNPITLIELSEAIDGMRSSVLDTFEENNELFLDLAENYRREKIYIPYLEEGAVLAETFSKAYDEDILLEQLQEFEKQMVPYDKLFRNYLVAEIFNNSLVPDSDLERMVVMFQWIGMEYAIIKHTIFLKWILEGSKNIPYTMVRDCMVIISRMTGYDDEDIYEYLESSFQNLIWEWGYFALICN